MKAIILVLAFAALACAGPAYNNQQDSLKSQQHQTGEAANTEAIQTLKLWCWSSDKSQPELTGAFKKLVSQIRANPEDETTRSAVMAGRICQDSQWSQQQQQQQKSANKDQTDATSTTTTTAVDADAHSLIKDVYMDALIACEKQQCMQQLVKIIDSQQVDAIRASYYMTRIAVSEKTGAKDEQDVKSFAESFIQTAGQKQTSEAVERQQMFAATALIGKSLRNKQQAASSTLKQLAQQVAKTVVDRYIKPVSEQEVQQYLQQQQQQPSAELAKKIAKRSAALKALANIPAYIWTETSDVKETIVAIACNKQEMTTARQSAIECLEQTDAAFEQLKQIAFDQEEPIEIRIAALRACMISSPADSRTDKKVADIVDQLVKHCDQSANQQHDDQFVLYSVSYLDNLATSQQPEHKEAKEAINANKQHFMKIRLLSKKFNKELGDVRKYSRNYKLDQVFNQIDSGLNLEGDIIYESQHKKQQQQQQKNINLPKLMRFNMSMPVMGETVNVLEVAIRQNAMDEELLGALKIVQKSQLSSQTISKVADSFKSQIEKQQQQQQQQQQQPQQQWQKQQQQNAEADLTIKVDGCTVVYMCADDFKSSTGSSSSGQKRNTRSTHNIVDELIQHLKQSPVSFNRGINFSLNERLAKVLDVEANMVAGLRFESRASGQSSDNFEIVVKAEPRFAFESIVGPAKLSSKKLLQRFSTKTAVAVRLAFKADQLVDLQVNLPMDDMELFTYQSKIVEKSADAASIYDVADYYTTTDSYDMDSNTNSYNKMKRSLLSKKSSSKSLSKLMSSGKSFSHSFETPEEFAQATGLRSKLRIVASPKDMSFFVQAVCQKTDSAMQGYRVKVEKVERSAGQKQYLVSVSTPGSRQDRTLQMRVVKQTSAGRSIFKTDVQSPKMAAEMKAEIVHDGRQYSVKVELASTRGKQWRHALEAGVQRGSQQQSGRVATTYKPYLSVDSSSIRRPVQMQGVVSYQQSPKSVISYELKCSNTGDFVQGKIIIDSRHSNAFAKRSTSSRRSMSSPLELVFQKDLTFTQETTAQVGQHAYKVHKMLDWDANKQALNADASFQHKNLRKSRDSQTIVSLQLDQERQVAKVERKCPQDDRKDFKLYIASDKKSQGTAAHQLVAELRYNGKRSASQQQQPGNLQSVAFYKHQVELHQSSRKSAQISYTVELNASELRFNEKLSGSAQVNFDRKQKTLKTEMSSRNKSAKIDVDYESLGKHQIDVVFQSERLSHRCNVRADQRQYSLQSRTESRNQNIAKIVLEIQKQQGECQLVVELPTKAVHYAADLKLQSGKTSSVAVQTPRFSSNVQFTFDTAKRAFNANKRVPSWAKPYLAARAFESLRFKSDLKDTMNKQAYWIDSNIDTRGQSKSYLRFDTPIYRSDLEYQPEQRDVKFGLFARSKRSISANDYAQLYSTDDSLLSEPMDSKLNLGSSKLWMIRSMISSPSQLKQAQEAVRRALFEYADRRQSHKHSVNWRPLEERLNIDYERQPSAEYENQLKPIRFNADIVSPSAYYNIFRNQHQQQKQQQQANRRPSTMSFDSENLDFGLDYDIKSPFDSQDEYNSYAKFNAQSRYPRSLFSKHESEIRYSNKHGYKGHVKHQDADKKHHSLRFEADQSPKKYAKIDYESDKHGKGQYSHDWHKTQAKRNSEQEYYTNQVSFNAQSPRSAAKDWSHQTKLSWDEPMRKMNFRERRSIHHSASDELAQVAADAQRRYNAIDYLKHLNANLNSQTYRNQNQLYKLDFDYKPESHARLNMVLPGDMLHSSAIEYEPTERLYKLRSKMLNQRTQLPSYELLASTKPVVSELATADQEPVFINVDHPMLERPISQRLAANLFRQPLKLDYSDMYGRRATFDFDQSPLDASVAKYAGLRQKRAALYYKNDQQDFEHNSSLDFYPQAFYGGMKKSSQAIAGDYAFKTETKYGPVMVVVNSDNQSSQLKMKSPLVNAQITVDESTGRRQAQIVKIDIDNKDQRVRLAKIVRNELPAALRKLDFVQQIANTIDNSRFEHQTEMLVSVVEAIFKIKSQTRVNQRQVLTIDGELDKQQNKLYAKIDGERTKGQLVADLINKSLDLSVDTDDKRTFQHQTRLVRTSDKYYSLDSVTSYKQQPLFKLSGKVSAMIFSEPEHLFSRRSSSSAAYTEDHISSFEAVLYGKKPTQISAQYDCLKKEANFVFENLAEKKVQVTSIKYDERSETVVVNAQLSSPYGRVYTSQAKLNLPGLMKSSKCRSSAYSCQSELMYSEKSGLYSAKYEPNQYLAVKTPYGQQTVKLY